MNLIKLIKKYLIFENILYIIFFFGILWRGYLQAYYQASLQWVDDFQWISWLYRIELGQIPYKDFFVLYGYLLVYLFYLPFKLLGGNFLAWNIIRYIILPVYCYITAVFLSKKIFKTAVMRMLFLVLAATFDAWGFFYLQPWMFRMFLGLTTILIISSDNKKAYFWGGVWSALLLFSSFEQGVYSLISITCYLLFFYLYDWRRKTTSQIKTSAMNFIAGYVPVLGAGFILLILTGGFNTYISIIKTLQPMEISHFGLVFPDFPFDKLKNGLFPFLISKELRYYWPLIIYFLLFVHLFNDFLKSNKINRKIVFVGIYGLFSFRTVLGRSDFGHLMAVWLPALLIVVWALESVIVSSIARLIKQTNLRTFLMSFFKIMTGFGVVLFLFLIRSPSELGFLTFLNNDNFIKERRQFAGAFNPLLSVKTNQYYVNTLSDLSKYISSLPKKSFYTHGSISGLYFLIDSPNPYFYDQDFWAPEKEQAKIIYLLEKNRNSFVVTLGKDDFFNGSILNDYFQKYYQVTKRFGDLIVLKRNQNIIFDSQIYGKLIYESEKGWRRIDKNQYKLITPPIIVSGIRIKLSSQYLPFLEDFGKTEAVLRVLSVTGETISVNSDTKFIPKKSEGGVVGFHLPKRTVIKAISIEIKSPGGLNPEPLAVEVVNTQFYD